MEFFALASLAVVAGLVSFSSPCTLPLLPGYLSFVSGLSPATSPTVSARRRTVLGAFLFVVGFSAVFAALGATSSLLGLVLAQHRPVVDQVAGVIILLMAASMLGLLRIPGLQREIRFSFGRISRGPAGAPLLGAAFALGWTPCVGPVLAAILSTAATATTAIQGSLLLLAYSAGLGVPFVLLAAGINTGKDRFAWLRRHTRHMEIVGGVLLAMMGIAITTGSWTALMSQMLAFYAQLGWPPL